MIDYFLDIISITPVMQNIDISNNTIGDTVMADILIETCLVDVTVSIYKGKQRVYNAVITGNHQSSFTVRYSFNVVESSVGEYGVRVIGDQSTTPLTFFDVTGKSYHRHSLLLLLLLLLLFLQVHLYSN